METISDNLELIANTKRQIKEAIETKGVTVGESLFEEYPIKISEIQTSPKGRFTGHADVEGLKAIGWTDNDIEYYQINGVKWNEEDDKYHKVPKDNIDLYGIINKDNIKLYKDILVYLPFIDTSSVTSFSSMFSNCYSLVSIPLLDTSNATSFSSMFSNCYSLVSIPLLDTSNVTSFDSIFYTCHSLVSIPLLDTSNATSFSSMFSNCYSLVSIPLLDTSNVMNFVNMFYTCYSLISIPLLDTSKSIIYSNTFFSCKSLSFPFIKNLCLSIDLNSITVLIDKEALLYIINNSIATTNITIKLNAKNYDKYSVDADVITALSNKPFVTLVK